MENIKEHKETQMNIKEYKEAERNIRNITNLFGEDKNILAVNQSF